MRHEPNRPVGEYGMTLLELAQLLTRRFRVAELATFDRYEPDYDQLTQFAGFIIATLNTDRELAAKFQSAQEVQSAPSLGYS